MPLALALLVLAAGWRLIAIHAPAFSNFAPLMALTFCGAVYFRDKRMWLVETTGRRTVPQIFIGDESIGGFDELRKLDMTGELSKKLAA